jgi:hypothetical protein
MGSTGIEESRMKEATAAHPPLEMETASRRQSATTRVWGSIGSGEFFAEGTAYTTTKWDVRHTGLARYRIQAGRDAHARAERGYPLAKGTNKQQHHTANCVTHMHAQGTSYIRVHISDHIPLLLRVL